MHILDVQWRCRVGIDVCDFASRCVQHGAPAVFIQPPPILFTQAFDLPQPLHDSLNLVLGYFRHEGIAFAERLVNVSVNLLGLIPQVRLFWKFRH